MLEFVKKWYREISEDASIKHDGTEDKWTKCEEGLPDSNRKVEVMIFGTMDRYTTPSMRLTMAKFNPHIGWEIDGCGVVYAWRDMSKELRNMMSDMDLLKRIGESCK